MAADVQIAPGAGNAPQAYEVPNATEIIPRAVNATFDGTGAGSSFVPTLEIISDGGVVVARMPTATAVSAGASAEVTFAPFLRQQATGGGGGITQIESTDGSVGVSGGFGPITDLSAFRPQFSQSTGTVTFVAPGAANVPWAFFLGDNFLNYTTATVPRPTSPGWYEVSAFATFGPLSAPTSSCDGTLTASGGYAPSPSSENGGLGSSTFGMALSWSIPPLRMKTTAGLGFVLAVDTDSAAGCTVNAQLNVAWLRPD